MPDEKKLDPFKPQQPVIPGVPIAKSSKKAGLRSRFLWPGVAAGAVIVIGASIAWWHSSSAKQAPPPEVEAPADPVPMKTRPVERLPIAPGEIATTKELSKAWSAKRFLFRDPGTADEMPAIAVRLPGGELWGVSLRTPYGTCDLEYVTDLEKLRTQYQFPANHPMIVDPCTQTVYDLMRYGSGKKGLVRGEIVRGRAIRPPIAIEIITRGNHVVADRME